MKKLLYNMKKGIVKVQIENKDDLWYLSQLIEKGDMVKGKTYRKIKLSKSSEKSRTEKKPVTVEIEVEKTDFSDNLKINGKVAKEIEDIPKGSYQSITLTENSRITIKKKWLNYQKQRLKEALSQKVKGVLIVVMDREKALFALTKKYGYDILAKIDGDVQKKDEQNVASGNFYEDIIKLIKQYLERYKLDNFIIASPAFFKEDLLKKAPELKKKAVLASCHSAEENAIKEVMKRDEIQTILKEERISKETRLVDELLKEISKDGKSAYGINQVKKASEMGAVEKLLVTDKVIAKYREKNNYEKIENIMKNVDNLKGEVHIINSNNEPGKELDGITGIGAILRYKINN